MKSKPCSILAEVLQAISNDINQLNLEYQAKFSQADELHIMLTELFDQHQFPSLLESLEEKMERDSIYMKEKSVEQGFDE